MELACSVAPGIMPGAAGNLVCAAGNLVRRRTDLGQGMVKGLGDVGDGILYGLEITFIIL